MASFEELERLLGDVSRSLDQAAKQIRDLDLDSQTNVRRFGEVIAFVSEMRNEIYARRPDLMPDYLRKR